MATYKSYIHVVRLDSEDASGLLAGKGVEVTAKIDGTNMVVWSEDGMVKAGSRKRELSRDSDNAGSFHWLLDSDDPEAEGLRAFAKDNPSWVLYGEWMGSTKFIGAIKDYDPSILAHMIIFDIFDATIGSYLSYAEMEAALSPYPSLRPYLVPLLGVLDNPTPEDIEELAKTNHAFLPDHCTGEGVVCKRPGFKDPYGHTQFGKLVINRPTSKRKGKGQGKVEDVEAYIVEHYLTTAELEKAKAKAVLAAKADSFDPTNKKQMGIFIHLAVKDLLEENILDIVKKLKGPVIDFKRLQNLARQEALSFVGHSKPF